MHIRARGRWWDSNFFYPLPSISLYCYSRYKFAGADFMWLGALLSLTFNWWKR
jgi:hypothetical protein